MRLVVFFYLSFFFLNLSFCQEVKNDSTKLYQLKEVVVTATRSEKNLFDVGKSLSLISQGQIKDSYINNLADVASSKEGIYIVGAGQNYGMNQSIFMRGANSNQTTIMIDGIRITDPSLVNNSVNISELTLSNIDRIEIVRGLNSILYGSSAIGGVINMISKKKETPGLNLDVNLNAGSFGKGTSLSNEELFLNYTSNIGLYTNINLYNTNVKGIDATIDTFSSANGYNKRDKDGSTHQDFIGKLGFSNNILDVYGSFKYTTQKVDLDKRAYVDDDNYKMNFERNLMTYGLTYHIQNNIDFKFEGGYSKLIRAAVDDSSIVDEYGTFDHTYIDERYKGKTFTNEIQLHAELPSIEFLLGGDIYKESMTSRLYYYANSMFGVYESLDDLDTLRLNTTTNSIFCRANINGNYVDEKLKNVSLALGLRYLSHSTFGSKLLYEINPQLKFNPMTILFASVSTGFNAPSLYQLYSPSKDIVSGITRGNNHLKPELSQSIEVGIKKSFEDNFDFTLSYFSTKTKNMIEYVYLWDKNIGLDTIGNDWMRNDYRGDTYLNLGDQTVNGIELGFRSRIDDKLSISGNISLVDGRINYKPSDIDTSITHGNHVQVYNNGAFMNKESEILGLVRRPSTANFSFTYSPVDFLSFKFNLKYVGRRGDVYYDSKLGPFGALGTTPVADYALIDLYSKYLINDNLTVGLKIENILDTKYVEIKGFSTRGRGFYLNLRYSLNY